MSKVRTTLIFPIVFLSVLGFLFSFSVQEASATFNWMRPTGHNDTSGVWNSPQNVYDLDTDPPTTSGGIWGGGGAGAATFCCLELTHEAITCNQIKFYFTKCRTQDVANVRIDIVYQNGSSVNVYNGVCPSINQWITNSFTQDLVTKAKIQIGINTKGYLGSYFQLADFQFYGEIPITVPSVATDVATISPTQLANNLATLKGNITNTGGENPSQRVLEWGTSSGNYTNNYNAGSGGTGEFSYTISLTPGTIYYYRAKAYNSGGWGYGTEKKVVIYQASGDQLSFKTCQCSTTTVGGCCDGCYFAPAGKVYGGGGSGNWIDATATTKCASTVNKCTTGDCSGAKRYPECQAGGTCDSSATTYYTSETVYASAGKVFTATCTDQDATSASLACDDNTNYFCTDGDCSGSYRYSECNGAGTCDSAATTYYQKYDVVASTGYTLTSTCGTTGTTICGYSSWNKCGGVGSPYSCQKGRDKLRCNATQACTYDVGDDWANVTVGYVCLSGSEIAASATYYCGFSAYNGCSADICDRKRDYLACNGANACNYGDYGDNWTYIGASKVCSAGSEIDATASVNTGVGNVCSTGSCSGEKRYYECDGSGAPTTAYYTSTTVYASANKVFTTTCTNQDATSQSLACDANTNYFCTDGDCSGSYRYSECNGAGTCDSAATTYYQKYDVVASTGYTLTSTCGITGTANCDANICWDGGGHHEKCDRRCNAAHSCDYYNCTDHCTNSVKDCDETGIDCGGSCPSCDITSPTTTIKVKRKSTGEDLTAASSWLRADTYTIQFEDHDQAAGSGSNCENCTCEYSIYSCDVGGTNCNTLVVSLTSRTPNFSFDIVAGKTAPTYNLEGVGRYRIYSRAKDMAGNSAFEYRYINFDFTPPRTEIR